MREATPHTINSTEQSGKRCIANVYRRRAESVIKDRSIDAQSRALIRYALETHDPCLAALVRRIDAGQPVETTARDMPEKIVVGGGGGVCDLNQFFAAAGTNYLPQVQSKPRDFASPLVCESCFGTIKLPIVQIGT